MTERRCHRRRAGRLPMFAVASLTYCLGSSSGWADDVRAQVRGGPPPPAAVDRRRDEPDTAPATGDTPMNAARQAIIRTALNPLLIRDRRHRLLLERGEDEFQSGDASQGIVHFQSLLDAPQDVFFWNRDDVQPLGAQANVLRFVHESPAEIRDEFERRHGPAARELLHRFFESGDRRLLFELSRRFPHTSAARDAAVEQLFVARDSGRGTLAAEWGRVLASDHYHWNRLPADVRELVTRQVAITANTANEICSTAPAGFTMARASTGRREPVVEEPSLPYSVPLWAVSFASSLEGSGNRLTTSEHAGTVNEMIRESAVEWLSEQLEDRVPIACANEAVVAGNVLAVRDFSGITAFDLIQGDRLWTYECAESLAKNAIKRLDDPAGKSNAKPLDFEAMFSANPILGRLTTDGSRVFLLDQVSWTSSTRSPPLSDKERLSEVRPPFPSDRANRLIALKARRPLTQEAQKADTPVHKSPLWSRGAQSNLPHDPLNGHAFLGSPLVVDDRLFVLTEADGQISLVAIEAATGSTLWRQAVALVSPVTASDALRMKTPCSPLYCEGVVLCPTEVGIVVGVDALTGRLQWVYDHLEEDQRTNSGRWAFSSGRKSDRPPLPSHSFVSEGRLLHLPRRGETVHCIDVRTGASVWTQPRLDSHVIGGVTSTHVILLGDRECRALALGDGEPLWRTITPEPAGLGFTAGSRYHLPTSQGPCVALDLSTGHINGSRFSRLLYDVARHGIDERGASIQPKLPEVRTETDDLFSNLQQSSSGNLLVSGEVIIATTPLGVAVFPQARVSLENLQAAGDGDLSPGDRLRQAELQLTLGDSAAAGETLGDLLSHPLSLEIQKPAERILREILTVQLEEADDPHGILDQLASLAHTDEQLLQLLLNQIDVALRTEDANLLVEAVDQLQSLRPRGLLARGEGYWVNPQQCVWERLSQLRQGRTSELQRALLEQISADAAGLLISQESENLEQFVTLFAGWEPAMKPRLQLAQRWIGKGRRQQAELLLLSDRFGGTSTPGNRVQQELASLYEKSTPSIAPHAVVAKEGHPPRPHSTIAQSPRQDSEFPVMETVLVALDQGARRLDLHRTAFASPTLSRVTITQHLCDDRCEEAQFCSCETIRLHQSNVRRRFFPKQPSSLVVLDRNMAGRDRSHSRLVIADGDPCRVRGEIDVPAAYWQAPQSLSLETGHVMVLGGEAAFGISLLEGKLLWSVEPKSRGKKRDKIKVGPIGSDFCVLQSARELRVVHPATGETLWLRNDLPPDVGLLKNDTTGVIADTNSLILFDADQIGFTSYHTQSGRELQRGSRPQVVEGGRRQRWAVGRRLVEQISSATGARLVVWDPEHNRIERDIPLKGRLVVPLPNEREFAYVTSEGRLQILDVTAERILLDLPVPASLAGPAASDPRFDPQRLVVFGDRERVYVNLMSDSKRASSSSAAEDHLAFPNVRVRGRLLAIDAARQEILWDRRVTDASVPLRADVNRTMLVLLRESRDDSPHKSRGAKASHQRLMIEVLDAASGETLAKHDDLKLAHYVDCSLINAERLIEPSQESESGLSLISLQSRVDVRLSQRPETVDLRTVRKDQDAVNR